MHLLRVGESLWTASDLGRKHTYIILAFHISSTPRCSLSASVLFLFSYGAFAYLLANNIGSYHTLAALFFVAGCGRVASYFSAIFASRTRGPGLATSMPLALSGLSPLFLSYVASMGIFQTMDGALDAPKFIAWMAVGSGVIHAIGAIGIRHVNDPFEDEAERMALLGEHVDEREKMLKKQCEAIKAGCIVVHRVEPDGSVFALLKDGSFWVYLAVGVAITGTVSTGALV
jgi:hypothetical protein